MFGVFGIATIVISVFGLGWSANDVAHKGVHLDVPAIMASE